MHRYRAYGLNLESEVPLSELKPCDFGEADVSIKFDAVEPPFGGGQARSIEATRDKFLLDKARIARFRAEKGSLIAVEPYPDSSLEEIKPYLLGSLMGAILLQRRIFPIHGSCMVIKGSGVLLTGRSGAGKSTVAAALLAKGCRILTDDVAAIQFGSAGPVVYPGYPGQKLWEDAIERTGAADSRASLNRITGGLEKYSVRRDGCFSEEPAPLHALYEIVPRPVPDIAVEEIRGAAKVDALLNSVFRKKVAGSMGLASWCCLTSMEIAKTLQVYRVSRPEREPLEDRISRIILSRYPVGGPDIQSQGNGSAG